MISGAITGVITGILSFFGVSPSAKLVGGIFIVVKISLVAGIAIFGAKIAKKKALAHETKQEPDDKD